MRTVTVPERARAHLLAHPRQPVKEAAAALGVSVRTLWDYRSLLIRAGPLRPAYARLSDDDLIDAVERTGATTAAAKHLRLSRVAVWQRLTRRGLSVLDLRADRVYTGTQVLAILGVYNRNRWARLREWCESGLLRATCGPGARPQRFVTADALMDFLDRPDCPISPARISDPDWRAYAEAARAGRLGPVTPRQDEPKRKPQPLCPDCGAPVSGEGRRCLSCAARGNRNARRRSHAAD